jgi:release factor glutamine methyltransferase
MNLTIRQALQKAKQLLDFSGVVSSSLDCLILMSFSTSFSKEKIISGYDSVLTEDQQEFFFKLIDKRKSRQPISQIIGKREFYGNDFIVSENVLDPRPDSETLVEAVLKNFTNQNQKTSFLEIGCGSGCLIISLLKIYLNSIGLAIDISGEALEICKKNSEANQTNHRLKLINSNLFEKLSPQKFDVIISNPPYIPSAEIDLLEPEVKNFEPRIALDGGDDGLDFYRLIAKNSQNFLGYNGKIFLEIGYDQKERVVKIFQENNFQFINSFADLSGIERILIFGL